MTDGLSLARQYKVPAKVAAFIPEHHGTRTRDLLLPPGGGGEPGRGSGRVPLPGPEAAVARDGDRDAGGLVRGGGALQPGPLGRRRSTHIVDEVFNERLAEGQLDESDLTLRNIRALAESFKATLRAVYHPRVEYPAPTEAEMLLRRLPFRRVEPPTGTENP